MRSFERAVLKQLVARQGLNDFRIDQNVAFKSVPPDANDLAIFLQTLPRSTNQDEVIVTFGVRSQRLRRFDAEAFGMPLGGHPRLGLLHYERSLGWLIGEEEPRFSGTPEELVVQISPVLERHVIPDLIAHASDAAIADAMLAHEPLASLTRNDLIRLAWLLSELGMTTRLPEVEAILRDPEADQPADSERRLIADVTADIESAVSAPDFGRES